MTLSASAKQFGLSLLLRAIAVVAANAAAGGCAAFPADVPLTAASLERLPKLTTPAPILPCGC
jgi:hypothetical protein